MDERMNERFVVDKEIECILRERRYPAFMYDLSVGGCMIASTAAPFAGGDGIHLIFNSSIEASGRIVWERDGNVGIQFTRHLDEATVKLLGFTPGDLDFADIVPRDRFGQILPTISRY